MRESFGWSFICLVPMVVVLVVVIVVMLMLRVVGPGDHYQVSRPLRRIVTFGAPLVLFAAGLLGIAFLTEKGDPPLFVGVALPVGV